MWPFASKEYTNAAPNTHSSCRTPQAGQQSARTNRIVTNIQCKTNTNVYCISIRCWMLNKFADGHKGPHPAWDGHWMFVGAWTSGRSPFYCWPAQGTATTFQKRRPLAQRPRVTNSKRGTPKRIFLLLHMTICNHHLSGLGDSNARPLRPERSALPTALNPEAFNSDCKGTLIF